MVCPEHTLNPAPDVPVNGDNSPVRWMAPEILRKLDNEDDFTWSKEGNMWSLVNVGNYGFPFEVMSNSFVIVKAVTLWEIMSFAERPFAAISDFRFVDSALNETDQLPTKIGKLRVLVRYTKQVQGKVS